MINNNNRRRPLDQDLKKIILDEEMDPLTLIMEVVSIMEIQTLIEMVQ